MLYFFHPDKSILVLNDWSEYPEMHPPAGTILYEPNDGAFTWVIYTNDRGSLITKDPRTLPGYVQAYLLIM